VRARTSLQNKLHLTRASLEGRTTTPQTKTPLQKATAFFNFKREPAD
jgi:hypothetical protein